jgi:hypothetical protein
MGVFKAIEDLPLGKTVGKIQNHFIGISAGF